MRRPHPRLVAGPVACGLLSPMGSRPPWAPVPCGCCRKPGGSRSPSPLPSTLEPPLSVCALSLTENPDIRMQGASRLPNSTVYVVEPGYLGEWASCVPGASRR